jgi:tetratricopeptide (TPR) repeat protein
MGIPLASGTRLGPYEILSELGTGGMGRVYLAQVTQPTAGLEPGVRVAVKIIHPHLLDVAARVERFHREAKAGMDIRHPNVVQTYAVGRAVLGGATCQYMVMEYVAGESLRSLLAELGRLPEELCRHIGQEVARGLTAIHAAGLVHRDIKPENVLVTADEVVKVADLGVARVSDASVELSSTGEFLGSIRYAAPEQFMAASRDVDVRADLYSLGTVLYELATGQHPFPGRDVQTVVHHVIHESPGPAGRLCPQLSPFLESVLDRLLAKPPSGRFQSARELLDVLAAGERGAWWIDCTRILRSTTGGRIRTIRVPRDAAFHGRQTELDQLLERFASAKRGEGQVVLVEGEAGIGKTRLLDELATRLEDDGESVAFLFGAYPPGGGGSVEGPYAKAVREFLGEHGLQDGVRKYLGAVPRLAPGFASHVLGEVDHGAEGLGRDAITTAFIRFMQALSAERPAVFVVEDLHFASEGGPAFFAALSHEVPNHRLLLIATSRPGLDQRVLSQLWRSNHCSRVTLPRLAADAVVDLLADAMHSETVAGILGARVAQASDGNPYFVLEFARQFRDEGLVHQRDTGEWTIERPLADLEFPSSLHDLVAARLAALSARDREFLELASCCGHDFDPALVAQAAGAGIVAGLRTLAGIERRDRLVHALGRRYVFDQHLVQAALYRNIPPHLREAYHAAIAQALEERARVHEDGPLATRGSVQQELCRHYLKGGLPDRARPYLEPALAALEAAQRKIAAGELAQEALAVPGMVEGTDRAELLLRASIWVGMDRELTAVLTLIDEALALAETGGTARLVARALLRRATTLRASGHGDEAMQNAERAMNIARESDDPVLVFEAEATLGSIFRDLGRLEESLAFQESALALAKQLDRPRDVMRTSLSAANALLDLGREEEALRIHEECLAMARQQGESAFEALELGNIGSALTQLGRFHEAREYHEQHLQLSREVGYRRGEMFASVNLGTCARALGRLAEARSYHEQTQLMAKAIGEVTGEAIAQVQLGMDDIALGELDRALIELDTAHALGNEINVPWLIADALRSKGALWRLRDRLAEAETAVREAIDMFQTMHHRRGSVTAKLELGRILLTRGSASDAAAVFEAVIAETSASSDAIENLSARALLAALGKEPPGPIGDALEREADRVPCLERMEIRYRLWKATGDDGQLRAAHRDLVLLEDHAPPASRTRVGQHPMHREIRQALHG